MAQCKYFTKLKKRILNMDFNFQKLWTRFLQMKIIYRKFAINMMKKLNFEENDMVLAKYLKALSHPVRLAIIRIIMDNSRCPHGNHPCSCGEHCEGKNCKCGCTCGNLVDKFNMSQSTISQHIKELKSAGLIEIKSRKGDYTVNHSKLEEACSLLQNIFELPQNKLPNDKKCICCG